MGLLDFLSRKKRNIPSEHVAETKGDPPASVTGEGVSQSSDDLAISQYSEFPRYFNIDGVCYDIDSPTDIERMPLITNVMEINGKQYGMDTILIEHYHQSSDSAVGYAAYDKCQEFRNNGIINKSERELEMESHYHQRQEKEIARKHQCDNFSIDDMLQFSDIPFTWWDISDLQHTNGIPWCMLNGINKTIALHYISKINDIIIDAQDYVPGIGNACIDLDNIDFDYPDKTFVNQMCCTRVECYPYTATGKLSKYPVVIQFATKFDANQIRTGGKIKILRDGNIGAATVDIYGNTYKIGLHGLSLVLKRVDSSIYAGRKNLFMFSEETI